MARILVIIPLRVDNNLEAKRIAIKKIIGNDLILPPVINGNIEPHFDLAEALNELESVDLVIADLSFERPSCYYELGMAQAKGIPTFLIAQHGTQLHQHAGDVRFYKKIEEYSQLIKTAVTEHTMSE